MRIIGPSVFLALAFFAALLAEPGGRETRRTNQLPPTYAQSVVFGPVETPTGGEFVVGLLLPRPDPVLVKDVIGEPAYRAFLAKEAKREGTSEKEALDEVIWEHEVGRPWESERAWNEQAALRAELSRAFEARHGVRLIFREVLADECRGVPLVVVDKRKLQPREVEDLEAYIEAGGRFVRQCTFVDEIGEARLGLGLKGRRLTEAAKKGLVELCGEVVKTSPLIARLERDPLALEGAQRIGDEVIVRLAEAPTEAQLVHLDPAKGRPTRIAPDRELRFAFPERVLDPFQHRLEVSWEQGGIRLRRAWSIEALVGISVVRRVLASPFAPAGGTFSARVVYSRTSSGPPLAGHREAIRVEQGERVLASAAPVSDEDGTLDLRLPIPDDAEAGQATLHVGSKQFPITITRDARVSLVTDRTLYREDDRVHARVIVHRVPSGRPAAGHKVVLRLGRVQKALTTSEHGIAAATFHLHGAKPGPGTVTAQAGSAKATARFNVQAFEKPTFVVRLEPETLRFDRRGAADVVVRAEYVNGAPVVGAEVIADPHIRLDLSLRDTRTDARGRATYRVKMTGRSRTGIVAFEVRDADGRRVVANLHVEVAGWKTLPTVRALDVPVVGIPCRLELHAANRRRLVVTVDGGAEQKVELSADGRAQITVTPSREALAVAFPHTVGAETKRLDVLVPPADRPLAAPQRRVARVGETLPVALLGPEGPVFVDLVRGNTVVRTLTAQVREGRGRLDIPLDADLAGRLDLRAYRLAEGAPLGSAVTILVLRNRDLSVDVRSAQTTWRPGDTARLDVSVTDREGQPAGCVLGYWAVDRAVLELSEWSDGHETTFDLPVGRGRGALRVAEAALTGDASALALDTLGGIRTEDVGEPYTLRHDSTSGGREAAAAVAHALADANLKRMRDVTLRALGRVPLAEIRATSTQRETLRWLLGRGDLEGALLLDPWGSPWTIWNQVAWWPDAGSSRRRWSSHLGFACASAGPDLVPGTADDLCLTWSLPHVWDDDENLIPGRVRRFLGLARKRMLEQQASWTDDLPFEGPVTNGVIGIGGGAGGAFRGRGGSRDLGTGGGGRKLFGSTAPARLRKDFPPTLCFVPEAIVGPDGTAKLAIELADSITTWKTRLVASAQDGATGVGYADIRVDQPLHLEPWIARRLTQGDELELPVALRNATDGALTMSLTLKVSEHLEIVGSATAAVDTAGGGTAAHRFRIRALAPGEAHVTLQAEAGDLRDAVQRTIRVRPDAEKIVEVANHTLASTQAWQPELRAGAGGEVELELRPGPLTEVLRGFEGLVRKPSGCFEQTSSTLYPMILALDYMQRTKTVRPQLEDRALGLIAGGYERLLGYEVGGEPGGFSLFGSAPASAFLTAYGLMEFSDMARVYPIDPDLIPRVVKFLVKRQQQDGSFAPTRFAHQELWAEGKHPAFNCTAYTAWALAKAGETGRTSKALAWLDACSQDVDSPYSLALAALAFLTADPDSRTGRVLVSRLAAMAAPDEGGMSWKTRAPTGLGCRGRTADIETTALAVQALLREGRSVSAAERGLERLLKWRGADGRFGTTQSTILALQALLAAESGGGGSPAATVKVLLGNKEIARQRIAANASSELRLDLGAVDPHALRVQVEGDRRVRSTLARTSYRPWNEHRTKGGRVTLDVRYPTYPLKVGEPAAAVATVRNASPARAGLVTAEIGVPPGCDIDPKLVKGKGLQRVERSEDAIVVYLLDLAPGAAVTIRIPFVPRHYLDVQTTPSTAYEYYVPHEAVTVPPQRVRAR